MTNFRLTVKHIERQCSFTLMWDGGRQLEAEVPFPEQLIQRYSDWQRLYHRFYQTVPISLTPAEEGNGLRGKAVGGGSVTAVAKDWRMVLVDAETRLLHDFHQWLRCRELYDIRAQIDQASRSAEAGPVDIFINCSKNIDRLPWEAWELGGGGTSRIRIARIPSQVRADAARPLLRRPRILAILGDETGLNFQGDREAVQSLASRAEIRFVGWQPGVDIDVLKNDIVRAIDDERGWDVLFFAGHSNEKPDLGGELAIAPNTAIALNEIRSNLETAKQRGLQFAIFNSCSGMDIAATLIDLGLNQVAVMREPIHNQVAQTFLRWFLQSLAAYQDVHTALITATESLKTKTNLTYPSAHLVPALFCRPESSLFQLRPYGWRQRLQSLLPSRQEAIAVGLLAALSWPLPVQDWLLDRRVLAQAMYRQFRGHVESTAKPPVLLLQIDEDSLRARGISEPNPMDRRYLAEIVEQLTNYQPNVVGMDYLLDRPRDDTTVLAQSVQRAIDQGVDFAFVAYRKHGQWLYALPEIGEGSRSADMGIRKRHLTMPFGETDNPLPLFYVLTELYQADLLGSRSVRHPITAFSFGLSQRWLEPIMDYSIPLEQVYDTVSAKALLDDTAALPQTLDQQVVIIAPGGYAEAGLNPGEDNFSAPLAVSYWYEQRDPRDRHRKTTGSEIHAYKVHHLLRQRLVIPIPDLWVVLSVALLTKLLLSQRHRGEDPLKRKYLGIAGGLTIAYALLSFELYLSPAAILLPVMLPVATVWSYLFVWCMSKSTLLK